MSFRSLTRTVASPGRIRCFSSLILPRNNLSRGATSVFFVEKKRSSTRKFSTLVNQNRKTYFNFFGFLVIVRQQSSVILERFGKFSRKLDAGLHFVIPLVDSLKSELSLKEEAINIPNQTAITNDNVYLNVDGVLFVKIVDAEKAYYGISNLEYAITQLAQTTMRSELGKITLDKTFAEREVLNERIVEAINKASAAWGIAALRYEIRDISPPASVKLAMDLQAEAERKKRAAILASEGDREAEINHAEGQRQAAVLAAKGEAQSTIVRARATAKGVKLVARALQREGGVEAVSLRVAEQYVQAWGKVAKKGTTILLPAEANNPAAMIASAFSIYNNVLNKGKADENKRPTEWENLEWDEESDKSEDDEDDDEKPGSRKDPKEIASSSPDQSKPLPL